MQHLQGEPRGVCRAHLLLKGLINRAHVQHLQGEPRDHCLRLHMQPDPVLTRAPVGLPVRIGASVRNEKLVAVADNGFNRLCTQ